MWIINVHIFEQIAFILYLVFLDSPRRKKKDEAEEEEQEEEDDDDEEKKREVEMQTNLTETEIKKKRYMLCR